MKVRKKAPCRLSTGTAAKKPSEDQEGLKRGRGPRLQEPRWGSLGTRGSLYRRGMGLATFPSTSERLKRATRKNTMLRGPINKVSISRPRRSGSDVCHVTEVQVQVFYLSGTQNNTRLDWSLKFLRQDNASTWHKIRYKYTEHKT